MYVAHLATARTKRSSTQQIPARIGTWDVLRVIGEGSWSRVFQVRPLSCAKNVPGDYALKLIKPELKNRDDCVAMLLREVEVAATVQHEHLLPILSKHVHQTPYYVVLPYLHGASVAELLTAHERLDTPDAVWIVRQVAEAAAALHDQGWLHADVKPGNVFVSPYGHATLLDCGLARRLNTSECRRGRALVGALEYAAPESFSAKEQLDRPADVYALGTMLFQMLTGRLPFDVPSPTHLANAHVHTPAPCIRSIVPQLPRSIASLLRSTLAKHPLRRPSASEFIDRLYDIEIETFHERLFA